MHIVPLGSVEGSVRPFGMKDSTVVSGNEPATHWQDAATKIGLRYSHHGDAWSEILKSD